MAKSSALILSFLLLLTNSKEQAVNREKENTKTM